MLQGLVAAAGRQQRVAVVGKGVRIARFEPRRRSQMEDRTLCIPSLEQDVAEVVVGGGVGGRIVHRGTVLLQGFVVARPIDAADIPAFARGSRRLLAELLQPDSGGGDGRRWGDPVVPFRPGSGSGKGRR